MVADSKHLWRSFVPTRLLLACNLFFILVVLTVSVGVTLRIPVRGIAWPLLLVAAVVYACIVPPWRKLGLGWSLIPIVVLLATSLTCSIGTPIRKHYFISTYSDTWSYCAMSEYFKQNSRGTDGGLPPIEQYAVHLKDTRFGTASFLAFLSEMGHANAAWALTPFSIIVLANIFAGFVVLARVWRCTPVCALGAGFFAATCSWIPDVLGVGSLDNLLFLGILPFFLARLSLFVASRKTIRSVAALAITASALIYVYPEGVLLSGAIFGPFILWRIFHDLRLRREFSPYALFAALVIAITAAYLSTFVPFIANQFHSSALALRPGEGFFPGLLSPSALPGSFGLGEEFRARAISWKNAILPVLFVLLILVALRQWWRSQRTLVLSAGLLFFLGIWQGVLAHYDYGMYKVIVAGTSLWIPGLFFGLSLFLRKCSWGESSQFQSCVVFVLLGLALLEKDQAVRTLPIRVRIPMKPFEQLQGLGSVIGGAGVLIDCKSDFDLQWATFYLHDIPIKIAKLRGYLALAHVASVLSRAKYSQAEPRWVLTDEKSSLAVWHNSYFSLVPRAEFLGVEVVAGPSDVETVKGKPFVWIGNIPTSFRVESPRPQTVRFYAENAWLGPSLPTVYTRTMTVRVGSFQKTFEIAQDFSIEVPLQAGQNLVDLRCDNQPQPLTRAGGDTRTLLLGLHDFRFEPRE
jgi:hypothetical protein